MSLFITIESGGAERAVANWPVALDGLTGIFGNQRADSLRCRIPGGNIADDPIFAFEAAVILRINRSSSSGADNSFSGGTIEFQGKRVGEVRDLRPNYEGVQYEFQGPWYDLEHTTYQQPFASWQSGSLTYPFQSELLLFTRLNLVNGEISFITNGAQIQDILQFLLDQYTAQSMPLPFQIGTIDPALNLLPLQCRPMACTDAIIKCLELSPDCTLSFDYTVQPPRTNVRSVYNLDGVTLPLLDQSTQKSLRLIPRPDLQPRAVIVNFKNTTTINGTQFIGYVKEKYGPHGANSNSDPDSGLRVVVDWIDVLGPQISSVIQSIETATVNVNAAAQSDRRAWWAAHDEQFADLRLRMQNSIGVATTFPDAAVTDADTGEAVSLADYPNELVDGTIHPWMEFNVKRVRISVIICYAVYDSTGTADTDTSTGKQVKRFTQKEHHIEITVTNGTTGTYDAIASQISGEIIPTDLAQNVWTAMNRLQYEGDYIEVKAAIAGDVSMQNVLNLSGGRAEWLTMNAQIQSLSKDYGRGQMQVSVGPAKHLNANQIMDIFRAWRWRLETYNPAVRGTGDASGTGATEISKNTPKKNTMEGLENPSAQTVVYHDTDSPTGAVKGQTVIDAKGIDTILTAATPTPVSGFSDIDIRTVQHCEVPFCAADGGIQYRIGLFGAPYTKS